MDRRIGVLCGVVALAGCQGVEGDTPGERVAWAPPVGTFSAEGPAIAAPLDEAMAAVRARPIWNEAEQAWVHRTGGLFARIDESVHLTEAGDPDWSVQIQLAGVGRAGGLSSGPVRTVDAWSDTVRIEREGVSEWYTHVDNRLEQGFDLQVPPAGRGSVVVGLDVSGGVTAEAFGGSVLFRDAEGDLRLQVSELVVYDANESVLPAAFEVQGCNAPEAPCQLRMVIDDTGAAWPLTVDPMWDLFSVTNSAFIAPGAAGTAVDLAGDRAVVSVPGDLTAGGTTGYVAVLERNQGGADAWGVAATFSEGVASYGASVAIDGRTVVVGAPDVDTVYVYTRDGTWNTTPVTSESGQVGSRFGHAVAFKNDRLVVGAPLYEVVGASSGAAELYVFDGVSVLTPVSTLGPSEPVLFSDFGWDVDLYGTEVLVGCPNRTGDDSVGRVYRFVGPYSTFQAAESVIAQGGGVSGTEFGASVALSGRLAVVGEPLDGQGRAHVYIRDNTGGFVPEQTMTPVRDAARFGGHVATDGELVLVGSRGTAEQPAGVWAYAEDNPYNFVPIDVWNIADDAGLDPVSAIDHDVFVVGLPGESTDGGAVVVRRGGTANPSNEFFPAALGATGSTGGKAGAAIAMADGLVAVGAPEESLSGLGRDGRVYLFDLLPESESVTYRADIPNPGSSGAEFGSALDVHEGLMVIGAPFQSTGLTNTGAVYVYEVSGTTPALVGSRSGSSSGVQLGTSVAIENPWIVAGAPGTNSGEGAAYLYRFVENGLPSLVDQGTNMGPSYVVLGGSVTRTWFGYGSSVAMHDGIWAVGGRDVVSTSTFTGLTTYGFVDVWANDVTAAGQRTRLGAFTGGTNPGSEFGSALALNEHTLFVGDPGQDDVTVYDVTQSSVSVRGTLTPPPSVSGIAGYGAALSSLGDRLVVGSTDADAVVMVERNGFSSSDWSDTTVLANATPGAFAPVDGFGQAVALGTDRVLVGSPLYDDTTTDDGRVTVFRFDTPLPPVAHDDFFAVDEDAVLVVDQVDAGLLANDFDGNGDALTVTLGTPANGSVQWNADGTFEYQGDLNFNGEDSFTYDLTANGDMVQATVHITVAAINDAPVATDDEWFTDEDTALVLDIASDILANDTDVEDGTPPGFQLELGPNDGSLTDNLDGTWTYLPDANFNGEDSFTYQAVDGDSATSAVATVTITVNAVNDAPVAVADPALATDEDTALVVVISDGLNGLLDNDTDVEDGTPPGFQLELGPNDGSLTDNGDGTWTYLPDANFNGADSFTYLAVDSEGLPSDPAVEVTIDVTPVNDLPVGENKFPVLDEGETFVASGADTLLSGASDVEDDADGLELGVKIWPVDATLVAASFGTVTSAASGGFTYTPNDPDFHGGDAFEYQLVDSDGGLSDVYSVNLTINPVNDAPTLAAPASNYVTDEDVTLVVAAPGLALGHSDVDCVTQPTTDANCAFSIEWVSGPSAPTASVVVNPSGSFTYTPEVNFNGEDTFEVQACDDTGACSGSVTVTIDVTAVDDPPVAVDDAYAIDEDTTLTVTTFGADPTLLANDSDPDGDAPTVDTYYAPACTSCTSLIVYDDGTFEYTPGSDFNGVDTFDYQVIDGDGNTDIATVTITVNAVNDPPVGVEDMFEIVGDRTHTTDINGTTLDVLANDTDVDGDALETVQVDAVPVNGTVVLNTDGTFEYTPNSGFVGYDTFSYTLTDNTVVVPVGPVLVTLDVDASITGGTGSTGDTGLTGGGTVDTGCVPQTFFVDADGDGFGDDESTFEACELLEGLTDVGGDCDDSRATVYPGAEEVVGDGIDQDCDGLDATVSGGGSEGCGCSSGATPATLLWTVGLLGLALRRRRG